MPRATACELSPASHATEPSRSTFILLRAHFYQLLLCFNCSLQSRLQLSLAYILFIYASCPLRFGITIETRTCIMSTPNPQYPAPQAGRMPSSMLNTPMKSPKRRVLGDLTPNAKIASSKQHTSGNLKAKLTEGTSPLKQQQVAPTAPMTSPAKAQQSTPFVAGKKRSFDEVNGTRAGQMSQQTPISKRFTERDAPSAERQRRRAAAQALASTVRTRSRTLLRSLH